LEDPKAQRAGLLALVEEFGPRQAKLWCQVMQVTPVSHLAPQVHRLY